VVVDGIVVAVSGEKNLTGKIIVHIGLPKTATTTLQSDFFPVFVNDFIEYWGVCQPRGKRGQSNAYFNFYRAVDTGLRVGEVRKELELKIAQGKTVIFSEEMITVSSTTSSTWREKLKNLGNILKGLQYDIVVTVRDPIPALFSYYVELHRDNYSHVRCNIFSYCTYWFQEKELLPCCKCRYCSHFFNNNFGKCLDVHN